MWQKKWGIWVVILVGLLNGCQVPEPFQKQGLEGMPVPTLHSIPSGPPVLEEIEDSPVPELLLEMSDWPDETVTLVLREGVDVRKVFFELAEQAQVNLLLHPDVQGEVEGVRLENQSFEKVVKTVGDLLDFYMAFESGQLVVRPDTPEIQTYELHFLDMNRSSVNRSSIATDVFTSFDRKGMREGGDNGSETRVEARGGGDFWSGLEALLKNVLQGEGTFSFHRPTGLLTVEACPSRQETVKALIKRLKRAMQAQVLIEAKVLEVTLDSGHKNGIDWRGMFHGSFRFATSLGGLGGGDASVAVPGLISVGLKTRDMSGLIHFIQTFGGLKTLSSPQLTVLNNQPAILKIAENQVYFRVKSIQHTIPEFGHHEFGKTIKSSESEIQTVPIGLVMAVQPSIDFETGEILLMLRPTISRISGMREDPAVAIASDNTVHSQVPVVEVREIDSVLRVPSGGIAILGGLMQEREENHQEGLPGLMDLPLFGGLFRTTARSFSTTELVILLQATIVLNEDKSRAG